MVLLVVAVAAFAVLWRSGPLDATAVSWSSRDYAPAVVVVARLVGVVVAGYLIVVCMLTLAGGLGRLAVLGRVAARLAVGPLRTKVVQVAAASSIIVASMSANAQASVASGPVATLPIDRADRVGSEEPPLARVSVVMSLTEARAAARAARPAAAAEIVAPPAQAGVVVVQAGDSLWSLCEARYGPPVSRAVVAVVAAVNGLTDPSLIMPGQQLRFPADPTDRVNAGDDARVFVREGDSLWFIASNALAVRSGSVKPAAVATAVGEMIAINTFASGTPERIFPGEELLLPASITGAVTEPGVVAPSPSPVDDGRPTAPVGVPLPPPVPLASTPATDPTPAAATAVRSTPTSPAPVIRSSVVPANVPATPVPTAAGPRPPVAVERATRSGLGVAREVLAGVSGSLVLASGLLVASRRLRRRRAAPHRAAGVVALSETATSVEQAVFRAGDVLFVTWAGQVLTRLVRALPDGFVGRVRAVELTDPTGSDGDAIEVLWDRPVAAFPPAGWVGSHEGWAWRRRFDPDEGFDRLLGPAIPGLVTIGRRDGRLVLVDVATFGSLALAGRGGSDVARSMMLSWCADNDLGFAVVSPVGFDVDGVEQLDRFEPLSPQGALATAHREAGLLPFGERSIGELRVFVVDASFPHVDELVELCQPGSTIAVVVVGDVPGAGGRLVVDEDGSAHLEPGGFTVETVGLTRQNAASVACLLDELAEPVGDDAIDAAHNDLVAHVEQIAHEHTQALREARDEDVGHGDRDARRDHGEPDAIEFADEPAGASPVTVTATTEAVCDASGLDGFAGEPDDGLDDGPLALLPRSTYRVRVLGPVCVDDVASLSGPAVAVLALLAVTRLEPTETERRLSGSVVQARIWGDKDVSPEHVFNTISRVRRLLPLPDRRVAVGRDGRDDSSRYWADPAVGSDLEQLMVAVALARTLSSSDAITVLRYGLGLVTGAPFGGCAKFVGWAAPEVTGWAARAEWLIEDAVCQLVELAFEAGDRDAIAEALRAGRRGTTGGSERITRASVAFAASRGSVPAFEEAWRQAVNELEFEPSPGLVRWAAGLRSTYQS